MRINAITTKSINTFKANYTKDIEKQFNNGVKRYQNDAKALAYYKDRLDEVNNAAPDVTVKTMDRMNCATGIAGYSMVTLNKDDKDYLCTWKNPEIRYEQCVKTLNLATLDGITALCKSLKTFE